MSVAKGRGLQRGPVPARLPAAPCRPRAPAPHFSSPRSPGTPLRQWRPGRRVPRSELAAGAPAGTNDRGGGAAAAAAVPSLAQLPPASAPPALPCPALAQVHRPTGQPVALKLGCSLNAADREQCVGRLGRAVGAAQGAAAALPAHIPLIPPFHAATSPGPPSATSGTRELSGRRPLYCLAAAAASRCVGPCAAKHSHSCPALPAPRHQVRGAGGARPALAAPAL